MMLAMALAHRQHATRSGGGWRGVGRREGRARPPGLCTLLAAIALFLVLVGSATLGVERLVDALENTRSDRLPAYNSAATSWRFGGSAAFANKTRGLELRVNGAPTPLVPRNGTSPEHAVSAEIADTRDDVARVRSTHVLYASIPRANTRDGASHGSINGSILVPPGVLVTFSVGRRSSDERTKVGKVGPAGDDSRGVAFAPFSCAVWSHSAKAQHLPPRHARSLKQSAELVHVSPGMDLVVHAPVVLSHGFSHPAAAAASLQQ